jgi:hypothetical protein
VPSATIEDEAAMPEPYPRLRGNLASIPTDRADGTVMARNQAFAYGAREGRDHHE